jgi:hypothetical protein
MGVLLQALEIIFEVQRKMISGKIMRSKISFLIYKLCVCVFFPSLWTLFTFKPHNFLIHF